jgi:ribosomal protein L40E
MKQYFFKEETPLAFHKFFWYVSLPIGFFVTIVKMVNMLSEMLYFNWLYAIDIGFFLIALSLILTCFIGFWGWKSYAWYSIMIYLSVLVTYCIISVVVYAIYIPYQINTAIGQLLGILIYVILVGIYYKKRRPLFFSGMLRVDGVRVTTEAYTSESVPANKSELQTKFCRKCGSLLLDDSEYCQYCGTKLSKITR